MTLAARYAFGFFLIYHYNHRVQVIPVEGMTFSIGRGSCETLELVGKYEGRFVALMQYHVLLTDIRVYINGSHHSFAGQLLTSYAIAINGWLMRC